MEERLELTVLTEEVTWLQYCEQKVRTQMAKWHLNKLPASETVGT